MLVFVISFLFVFLYFVGSALAVRLFVVNLSNGAQMQKSSQRQVTPTAADISLNSSCIYCILPLCQRKMKAQVRLHRVNRTYRQGESIAGTLEIIETSDDHHQVPHEGITIHLHGHIVILRSKMRLESFIIQILLFMSCHLLSPFLLMKRVNPYASSDYPQEHQSISSTSPIPEVTERDHSSAADHYDAHRHRKSYAH